MNISLLMHTVSHLKLIQIAYQLKYKLCKTNYKQLVAPISVPIELMTEPIQKYYCYNNGSFNFLNLTAPFTNWNDNQFGALWAYNLNYFDWIGQNGISNDECLKWIDKFIAETPTNKVGLDPYPTALRCNNWVRFFVSHPQCRSNERDCVLYSQYRLLERSLEYHLLGNHLLEDAFSLVVGSFYFQDIRLYRKSSQLLVCELKEQLLSDGAHYEQSPMYHCILLDRLLDVYNIVNSNKVFNNQDALTEFLRGRAVLMLGHLESIIYSDGSIPLLNDSAVGIAPTSTQLFDYAKRLELIWEPIQLAECGYRKFRNSRMEAIIDIGNITATYQPGHSHADTFNYELRIDGEPFIVDTGISTYNKNERRQYERSTAAHNTVTTNNKNSSEVWNGFRVGKRAETIISIDKWNEIVASHNGYGKYKRHTRRFSVGENKLQISDWFGISCEATNYIHFSPNVRKVECSDNRIIADNITIFVDNALYIEVVINSVSSEYNKLFSAYTAIIYFKTNTSYTVQL